MHLNAHVKGFNVYLYENLGHRILEERERLDLSQLEASKAVGIRREMWAKYEAGAEPGAKALAGMASIGADVQYILTGQRQGQGIGESAVHQAVLDAIDLLSLDKKVDAQQLAKAVVKLCAKSGAASTPPPQQHFEGGQQIFHQAPTGDIAARDIIKGKASKGK